MILRLHGFFYLLFFLIITNYQPLKPQSSSSSYQSSSSTADTSRITAIERWQASYAVSTSNELADLKSHSFKAVFFNSDGTKGIGVGSSSVSVWETKEGKKLYELTHGPGNLLVTAVLSPDRNLIVTCSNDSTAKLWEISSGKPIHTFNHTAAVTSATISLDGNYCLTSSLDTMVKVWNIKTGALERTLSHSSPVLSACFGSDTSKIISCTENDAALLWDLSTGGHPIHCYPTRTYFEDLVKKTLTQQHVRESIPALTCLISESFRTVLEEKSLIRNLVSPSDANAFRVSPGGTYCFMSGNNNHNTSLFDLNSLLIDFSDDPYESEESLTDELKTDHLRILKRISRQDTSEAGLLRTAELTLLTNTTTSVAIFNKKATNLLVAHGTKALLVSLPECSIGASLEHSSPISAIAISDDSSLILTISSATRTIKLWNNLGTLLSGNVEATLSDEIKENLFMHPIIESLFSPDNSTLTIISKNFAVTISTQNIDQVRSFKINNFIKASCSDDSKYLFLITSKAIILIELASNSGRYIYKCPIDIVVATFGQYLDAPGKKLKQIALLGLELGKAYLIDLETGEIIHELPHNSSNLFSVALSPDGSTCLTASNLPNDDKDSCVIHLWDTRSGKKFGTLKKEVLCKDFDGSNEFKEAFFNSDGTHVFCISVCGDIFIWDVASLKRVSPPYLNIAQSELLQGLDLVYGKKESRIMVTHENWVTFKTLPLIYQKEFRDKLVRPNSRIYSSAGSIKSIQDFQEDVKKRKTS